ncbi:MAG: hypothetical protein ACRC6L_12955 [Steroidobacteraceae bacterium]
MIIQGLAAAEIDRIAQGLAGFAKAMRALAATFRQLAGPLCEFILAADQRQLRLKALRYQAKRKGRGGWKSTR